MMIKKDAFSALEIILVLIITAIIGVAILPLLSSSNGGLSVKSTVNNQSLQDNINEQVNQIENIKKQNEKLMENINQDY